jgi:hypothetical protein
VSSGIVEKIGRTGRNARYRLRKKADINPTIPTLNEASKGKMGHVDSVYKGITRGSFKLDL